jgi:ABC-2 type transport system ATP-binding protein
MALEKKAIIIAKDLVKDYRANRAVDGLSITINEGEIFGLIGPDGAGKTTTLQMLVGVLPPTGGTISIFGNDVVRNPEAIRTEVGYMPQGFSLYEDLSVWENMRFFGMLYQHRLKIGDEWVERLLSFSRLSPFLSRPAGKLSGGMKKKLALCCALIHRPRLVMLDEPTTGVDPISRFELWEILYPLVEEGLISILFTSPYMDEAERATQIALIASGRILTTAPPRAVRESVPGVILEIEAEKHIEARDILRASFGASKVNIHGHYLHLLTENPKADRAQIKKLLKNSNINLISIREKHISLEDAFISRIGAERAGRASQSSAR